MHVAETFCDTGEAPTAEGDRDPLPAASYLLCGFLACFLNLGLGASLLSGGLFFRDVALRFRLVLLGLALADQMATAEKCADGLFGLALDVFQDALDGFDRGGRPVDETAFVTCRSPLGRVCCRDLGAGPGKIDPSSGSTCGNSPRRAVVSGGGGGCGMRYR